MESDKRKILVIRKSRNFRHLKNVDSMELENNVIKMCCGESKEKIKLEYISILTANVIYMRLKKHCVNQF